MFYRNIIYIISSMSILIPGDPLGIGRFSMLLVRSSESAFIKSNSVFSKSNAIFESKNKSIHGHEYYFELLSGTSGLFNIKNTLSISSLSGSIHHKNYSFIKDDNKLYDFVKESSLKINSYVGIALPRYYIYGNDLSLDIKDMLGAIVSAYVKVGIQHHLFSYREDYVYKDTSAELGFSAEIESNILNKISVLTNVDASIMIPCNTNQIFDKEIKEIEDKSPTLSTMGFYTSINQSILLSANDNCTIGLIIGVETSTRYWDANHLIEINEVNADPLCNYLKFKAGITITTYW